MPAPVTNYVSKCAYKTKTGIINGRPKPHNQDSFLIRSYLKGQKGQYLFAVCDGHGPNGHFVSAFLKQRLVLYIEELLPMQPCSQPELARILKWAIAQT